MNNFLSLSLTVLVQTSPSAEGPPVPMTPPPPVGDVPIDGNLWILIISGLIIGGIAVYFRNKRLLKTH